jgi:TatD DNase family protein
MFQGTYNDKVAHASDFDHVLTRAKNAGVLKIMATGTTLEDSKTSIELARKINQQNRSDFPLIKTTVGVHPTRCNEFEQDPDEHLKQLLSLAQEGQKDGTVAAIGECGLDYDRTKFCDKDVQQKYFVRQFELAEQTQLPMFLHNRNTGGDFARILRENKHRFKAAVVHSFDGPAEELEEILNIGEHIFIGVNGCSLKTEQNLQVVKKIPINRMMIETDAPWCDVRSTHAGFKYVKTKVDGKKKERFELGKPVKGRNEPDCIRQVLEVIAGCRNEDPNEIAEILYENANKVFFN